MTDGTLHREFLSEPDLQSYRYVERQPGSNKTVQTQCVYSYNQSSEKFLEALI
jgi:hypothetical protein